MKTHPALLPSQTAARKAPIRFAPTETDIALVVGRAAWWVPSAAKAKNGDKKQKLSFADALKDFLGHVSFHCYGKLVEPGRRFLERFFWIVFHITALTILIIFLWNTRNDEEVLMSTTIYNPLYPIAKVPFPMVVICSANRISNASATAYAKELSAKDPKKRDVKYFYDGIKMLSYNYFNQEDSNIDLESALEFQNFLDIYDTDDDELFYNTRRHMQMLTPNCSDILVQCRLAGKPINCTEEFEDVLTSMGFCCAFNSDGRYSKEREAKKRFFGKHDGLDLVLNESLKDHFSGFSTSKGFLVSVLSSGDYTDVASSSVHQRFAPIGWDSYLPITALMLRTVDEARYLRPEARNCLFEDEMPRAYGRSYSFNKCLTRCRIHSILVLCECLMFMSPYMYLDVATDTVYCTLKHKECLRRYDYKWRNVITHRKIVHGLEREMEDALFCPECLPSCTETRYKMAIMSLPLNERELRALPRRIDGNTTNLAQVHVYFVEPSIQYAKRILKSSWFEVFSTVGSICGIMTGFSLIGICELLFFLGKQSFLAIRDGFRSDRMHNRQRQQQPAATTEALIILP